MAEDEMGDMDQGYHGRMPADSDSDDDKYGLASTICWVFAMSKIFQNEKDGFIVDDIEEEKEDSDEERHRKKKKKRRESERSYILNEDDYDLLQDNNITSFHGPNLKYGSKFKRLNKVGRDTEAEQSGFSDEEESDRNIKGGHTAEEKLNRSLFGDAQNLRWKTLP